MAEFRHRPSRGMGGDSATHGTVQFGVEQRFPKFGVERPGYLRRPTVQRSVRPGSSRFGMGTFVAAGLGFVGGWVARSAHVSFGAESASVFDAAKALTAAIGSRGYAPGPTTLTFQRTYNRWKDKGWLVTSGPRLAEDGIYGPKTTHAALEVIGQGDASGSVGV